MGKYGSCSVGRLLDRRWKLSPQAIATIKRLHAQGRSANSLAVRFGVSRSTVVYWVDDRYRDRQRAKNAQRKKTPEEEHEQTISKQYRRDLVRHKVRAYTRRQMKAYRNLKAPQLRPLWAKQMRDWRAKNKAHHRKTARTWWHKKKCTCLKYGDHHIYGKGWPKGRKRGKL